MSDEIIGLHHWFESPPGRYLLGWEQGRYDEAVADLFGYHALQLGMPPLQGLRTNRIAYQWLALDGASWPQAAGPALWADPVALPFLENSLDLVLLPHTLELSCDPHAALREVARVLVPEGRVVISGFNATSLWGLRQRRARLYRRLGRGAPYLPDAGEFIGYWRLRDWLRLLNFEVEGGRFGCYRPPLTTQRWLERYAWMDRVGDRWWPVLGSVYFLTAVKRVRGMRLVGLVKNERRKAKAAPAVVANREPVEIDA